MKPSELPAADTLIEYQGGAFGPLMFHFAAEGDSPKRIAEENGFAHCYAEMGDVLSEDDPLWKRYEAGENVLAEWTPPEKEGWKLVGKNDSEEGYIAHYIKPRGTDRTPEYLAAFEGQPAEPFTE